MEIKNSNIKKGHSELLKEDKGCPGVLSRLYLRCVASGLEEDIVTGTFTDSQIEDIKKRCERVSQDERISKYGEIESFPISNIQYFLRKYHKGSFIVKFKDSKEGKIESLEKLFLCAKRFVDNFFYDMQHSHGETKANYQIIKKQICQMYKITDMTPKLTKDGLVENEDAINKNNKKVLRALEIELTARIMELIENDKEHDISVITALSSMTYYPNVKKLFQNLLKADFEDLSKYATSEYRSSISSMCATSCEIPNIKEFNNLVSNLKRFAEKKLGNKEIVEKLLSSISGMFNGQGIPTHDELETIKEIILDCKKLDNDNYLDVFSSFTSMLCTKGGKGLGTAKTFFENFIKFSQDKLKISDKKKITKLFSSISGMYNKRGIPTQDEFITIKKVILDCKDLDNDNYTNVFRSFTSMLSSKGGKDLGIAKTFFENFIKFSQDELQISDKKKITKLFGSISGMYNQQGIPTQDEFITIKEIILDCKNLDNDNYIDIFRSFSSMLGGKGCENLGTAKTFFENFIKFSQDELKILDKKEIAKLFSSISGMYSTKGIPTQNEFETIKEIILDCKNLDNDNFIDTFSSFTSMLNGKGGKDLGITKTFFENFTKFSQDELKILDKKEIAKLFSSISGMFSGRGVPTQDEFKSIKEIILNCKNLDNDNFIDTFSSFTSMLNGKGGKDLGIAKTFFENFIKFSQDSLKILDKKETAKLFSSISGMYSTKGIPTQNEFKTIKKIILVCKNLDTDNYIDVFRSFSSMLHAKGCKDLDIGKTFFENFIKFSKDELKILDKKEIAKLFSSISGMYSTKGIPTQNEFKTTKKVILDCKNIDNDNFIDVFSSITSMLSSKGDEDLGTAKTFFENFIKFSKDELKILDKKEIAKLFSSISGMFSGRGVPTQDEFKFIKEIILDCKNLDNDNYIDIFSSFSSMLNGKGCKDLGVAKTFFENFIKFSNDALKILDKKEIAKLFSSISGMYHKQGVPTKDEFKNIKEIIIVCKIKDSENFIRFFQNISCEYAAKKVPSYEKIDDFIDKQYKKFLEQFKKYSN